MKKLALLSALLVLTVLSMAQRPKEFFKSGSDYSASDMLGHDKDYDSTFMLVPATFDVTGTNLSCGDSLGIWTYSSTANLFLFGTSEYYGRYAQKYTAPYNGRIDSVKVYLVLFSVSTGGRNVNVRIHNVDATYKGPVSTSPLGTATVWTTLQIDAAATLNKWPVFQFPTPVTLTQGQEFFVAVSMPNPADGDTASLVHMDPNMTPANCLTVTDSTVWGYTAATPYDWANCARDWGFAGTVEVAILPYFTYTVVTTGLTDEDSPEITLFPNPASTDINISGAGKNAVVVMTNAMGQVVYQDMINEKTTIHTEGMSEGLYFVKVNSTVGKVILKK